MDKSSAARTRIDRWTLRYWIFYCWLCLPQRFRRFVDPDLCISEWASPSRPELSDGEDADV